MGLTWSGRSWGTAKPASVTATLYDQSIPSSYLRQRFETAPRGEATGTLWSYAGRLDVQAPGSPLRDWNSAWRAPQDRSGKGAGTALPGGEGGAGRTEILPNRVVPVFPMGFVSLEALYQIMWNQKS